MEKAFSFLDCHPDVAFATVDLSFKPRIRPFRIRKRKGSSLFFTAGLHKAVAEQLKANPFAELLATEGKRSVRVAGVIMFDLSPGECRDILIGDPVQRDLYQDDADPICFRMVVHKIDYYDLDSTPPVKETFHI